VTPRLTRMTAAGGEVRCGVRSWPVLVAACASAPPAAPPPLENHKPAPAVTEPGLTISLTRQSTCATCPAYVVHLSEKGVTWGGVLNVRVKGEATGSILPRQVRRLATAIDVVRFFERDANGEIASDPSLCGGSITPAYTLRIREGEKYNEMTFAPCQAGLVLLVGEIEDAAGVSAWR